MLEKWVFIFSLCFTYRIYTSLLLSFLKQFSSQIIFYYYKNTICNVFYTYNGIIWRTEVLMSPNLSKFSFIVCTHGSFKMHPLLLNKHIFHYHVPKNTCIYMPYWLYTYIYIHIHIYELLTKLRMWCVCNFVSFLSQRTWLYLTV